MPGERQLLLLLSWPVPDRDSYPVDYQFTYLIDIKLVQKEGASDRYYGRYHDQHLGHRHWLSAANGIYLRIS